MSGGQVWHRREKETPQAYDAFVIYCEMPYLPPKNGRSLRRVSEALKKEESLIERWSSNWNWVERAKAYDDMMHIRREETLQRVYRDDILTMHEFHRNLARSLLTKVAKRLNAMAEEEIEALSVAELIKMMEVGIKVEKESIGQPSTLIGSAQFVQLEKALQAINLTPQEVLDQIIAQATEIKDDD